MTNPLDLDPLAIVTVDPIVAALPKADLHLHQEWSPRLDRVLSRRAGQPAYDWRRWARQLMDETPPGMPRLDQLAKVFPATAEDDAHQENFIARIEDLLDEGAADGAVMVEMRFGGLTALQHPDFMVAFREAERRVRLRHPDLRAAAIYTLLLWDEPDRLESVVAACLRAANAGLAGIDLLYRPYDAVTDWQPIYRIAGRAADAGLLVTAHAGEFSSANLTAALRTPGLSRLGHATCADRDLRLLDAIAQQGVTIECSLSCNVVLGAVPTYAEHPIWRFIEYGIPVALCTDNPVQLCTTIGREYAIAHALGFTPHDLLTFTMDAIRASFLVAEHKRALLEQVGTWRLPGLPGLPGQSAP